MNTLLSSDRIQGLKTLAGMVPVGCAAEVGVYKGGSLKVIAKCFRDQKVFGFDTFEGLPRELWTEDEIHRPGDFNDTSLQSVRQYLSDCPNVTLIAGIFPESANRHDLQRIELAFVHIDTDFYLCVRDAFNWVWPRMVSGGIVVFDDYGWKRCPGVSRVLSESGCQINSVAPMQAYVVKD
jgi:O-methyltransferase